MAQFIKPPGDKLPQVLNELRTRLKKTEHHIEQLYTGSSDTTGPLLTYSTTVPAIGNLGDTWFKTDGSGNILGTYECTAAYTSGAGVSGDWALNQYNTTSITPSAVTNSLLAANSVASGNVQANAIASGNVQANAIASANLQNNSVATQHIQSAAVTSAQVATATVQSSHVGANQFGLNMIPDPTFANSTLNALRIASPSLNTWTISGGAASTVQTTTRSWLYLTPAAALWLNPGEQYYLSVSIACTSAQGGAVGIGIANTAGTQFADLSNTFGASTGTGTFTLSGIVTIPAGFGTTGFIRLYTGADASHTPTVTFTNPVCQPATLFSPTIKGGLIDSATINGSTINVDSVVDGGLFAYTQANTASNANPQFTSNVTSWTGTNTTISWVTGTPPHMLMTTTGSNAISVANTHTTVTPGNSVAIEFAAGITAGTSIALQCQFFTVGNALISTVSTAPITTSSGQQFTVATVPASASYAVLTIVGVGTAMSATATVAAMYVNNILDASITPGQAPTSDQYGNAVLSGVVSYNPPSGYVQLDQSSIFIVDNSGNNWIISPGTSPTALQITTPGTATLTIQNDGNIQGQDPNTGAPAGWHSVGLSNSWTGFFKFKFLPDNTVMVSAQLTVPAGVANPSNICGAPSNLWPLSNTQYLTAVENGGTPFAGAAKICEILTTGVVHIYDAVAGDTVRISGTYPLDL